MEHKTTLAEKSTTYVFGYGSLMNLHSLWRTLPNKQHVHVATLSGFRRKVNAPVGDYLYLNLVECHESKTNGVLIEVTDAELALLDAREIGYNHVDVTERVSILVDAADDTPTDLADVRIFAFIAPDQHHPDKHILRSYLHTCIQGVPDEHRDQWLLDTEICNTVLDDLANSHHFAPSAEV